MPIVSRGSFCSKLWPVLGRMIFRTKPHERHEIDLLINVQRIYEAEDITQGLLILPRICSGVKFCQFIFRIKLFRFLYEKYDLVRTNIDVYWLFLLDHGKLRKWNCRFAACSLVSLNWSA